MSMELQRDLENRLEQIARSRSLSVDQLVEEILQDYLNSLSETPVEWVRSTQQLLAESWVPENFSDWQPPHAN